MNLDDRLSQRVHAAAADIAPPPPDTARLEERGRRVKTTRVAAAVFATAVVTVGAGVTTAQLTDDAGPSITQPAPDDSSPTPPDGLAASAVWVEADVLHVGARTYAAEGAIASPVEGGVVYSDGAGMVWYVEQGAASATQIGSGASRGVVGDITGKAAAWIDESGPTPVLVVRDVVSGDEVARLDLGDAAMDSGESMTDPVPPVISVLDGVVHYRADAKIWRYAWETDTAPTALGSVNRYVDAAGELTVVRRGAGDVQTLTYRRGASEVVPESTVEADGGLSPDGRWHFTFSRQGAVVVDTSTGEVRPLYTSGFEFIGAWTSADTLLIVAPTVADWSNDKIPATLVACRADNGACTDVTEVDDFVRVTLPAS